MSSHFDMKVSWGVCKRMDDAVQISIMHLGDMKNVWGRISKAYDRKREGRRKASAARKISKEKKMKDLKEN